MEVQPCPPTAKSPTREKQRRAQKIYDVKIRPLLAPADEDKYVMIDILTGDYEIGENRAVLIQTLRERRPDAVIALHPSHINPTARRIRSPRAVRKTDRTVLMHYGKVNLDLEPRVTLTVLGADSRSYVGDFVIDTGYSGEIILPPD